MRAMASSDGGATFTGVDLRCRLRARATVRLRVRPSLAFDSNGNAYYSYIIVFFSAGGSINGPRWPSHDRLTAAQLDCDVLRSANGGGQFNDKPMITVDTRSTPNRIYVAWDNATGNSSSIKNGNNVVLSRSTTGQELLVTRLRERQLTGRTGGIGADPTSRATGHCTWRGRTTRIS